MLRLLDGFYNNSEPRASTLRSRRGATPYYQKLRADCMEGTISRNCDTERDAHQLGQHDYELVLRYNRPIDADSVMFGEVLKCPNTTFTEPHEVGVPNALARMRLLNGQAVITMTNDAQARRLKFFGHALAKTPLAKPNQPTLTKADLRFIHFRLNSIIKLIQSNAAYYGKDVAFSPDEIIESVRSREPFEEPGIEVLPLETRASI